MLSSPDSRLTLEPGFRLDRYELLCPIAQGGMAQVWLARLVGKRGFEKLMPPTDINDRQGAVGAPHLMPPSADSNGLRRSGGAVGAPQLVAVKSILSQYATDLRFQQMFLDEARIASGIEHPNVAQIFDLGEQGELLYLVMEWVDGESLSQLIRVAEREHKRIPIGIVARVCADACAGLHAAHELVDKDGNRLNVVHRDVSPQNVLVSVKGAVKLIDFGIAKARDRVAGETNTGMFKGKILYMAPEQAMGKPVDRRADLWAIGAMLYHMLSGRPAYEGDNPMATLHRLTDPNLAFDPLPDEVPAALREVVARALVRDPDKRVATASELGNALEEAIADGKLTTTSRDVAKYVVDQLRERNEARRKAVELALKAAEQRQQFVVPAATSVPSTASVASEPSEPLVESGELVQGPPRAVSLDSTTISLDDLEGLPTWKRSRLMVSGVTGAVLLLVIVVGVAILASTSTTAHLTTPPDAADR